MKKRSSHFESHAGSPRRTPSPSAARSSLAINDSPPFRAVLLDDDEEERAYFRSLLRRHPSVLLTGEAKSFKEAVELVLQTRAGILFLESEINGRLILDECQLIPNDVQLIFLTCHQATAVRAFELDALDFLVKPLSSPRLAETIRRLLRIDWKRAETVPAQPRSLGDGQVLIPFERGRRGASLNEITLIQAFGNYTRVTFDQGKGKSEIVLRSLAKWEQLLPMPPFLRVHRNAVVHSKKVRGLEDCGNGSVLRIDGNEETIPVSRRCLPEVRRTLFAAA